ncbi:MAG: polysaccharide deacetylase family protein [Streptococcaceae bacterium]|jgi:peptidoglycan/xylan/chitin deacetylase (PgdA/CDA1 family)|nr:polysaccharide deacetylase family protein [Streptococcaceae bacterium]
MKKNKLYLGVFTSILAIAAISFFFFHQTHTVNAKKAAFQPISANELKARTLKGISIQTITNNENGYLVIHYPQTENLQVNKMIQELVDENVQAYKNEAVAHEADGKLEYYLTFETHRLSENIISFKFDKTQIAPYLAHPVAEIITKTFNLQTGKEIKLIDLLTKKEDVKVISNEIYNGLKNTPAYKGNQAELDTLKNGLAADNESNFQSFVLDDSSIIFYFSPYQIGSGMNQTNSFSIKLEKLKNIFKPEMLENVFTTVETSDSNETSSAIQENKQTPKTTQENKVDTQNLQGKKLIALTFDDGPDPNSTPQLIEYLKSEGIHATFFVLGSRVEFYPQIVQEAYRNGNQIGSHTYNHYNLSTISPEIAKDEIDKIQAIIAQTIGHAPQGLRPPYGSITPAIAAMTNQPVIEWSVDTLDWQSKNPDAIYSEVMNSTTDGSIILMHDIYTTTVEAVKRIVPELKAQDYTFVTVDQLIQARAQVVNGQEYYSLPPQP